MEEMNVLPRHIRYQFHPFRQDDKRKSHHICQIIKIERVTLIQDLDRLTISTHRQPLQVTYVEYQRYRQVGTSNTNNSHLPTALQNRQDATLPPKLHRPRTTV